MNDTEKHGSLGAISAALYVSFQVIANVLSVKIITLGLLNWPTDGGTLIYPLTFTLRDFIHKTLGKKISRQIIILAALVNVVFALLLWLVGWLPADPSWPLQEAYDIILFPIWRITAASIIAQVVSELADTEIFSWVYKRTTDVRAVLASNSVALAIDSAVFCVIAFGWVLPWSVVLQIMVTNVIIKMVLSLVSTPTIKLVPRTAEFEKI